MASGTANVGLEAPTACRYTWSFPPSSDEKTKVVASIHEGALSFTAPFDGVRWRVTTLVVRSSTKMRVTPLETRPSKTAFFASDGDFALHRRLGRVDLAVCGGAEGLCALTSIGFGALRATSPEPCRPFDAERKGLNLGEAGAVLILESAEHARRRGARVLARLVGSGLSCDAHHMTAPEPQGQGALRAMRAACVDAGLSPDAVDYVNAHGTATPHNDAAESAALKSLFSERAAKVPVSSIKSMVGHTLIAAGSVEAVISLATLSKGVLPPAQLPRFADTRIAQITESTDGPVRSQLVTMISSESFDLNVNRWRGEWLRRGWQLAFEKQPPVDREGVKTWLASFSKPPQSVDLALSWRPSDRKSYLTANLLGPVEGAMP